ncbi:membrane protein [Roseobacter cerasinus]|uniref:Membrane protein n=1 Tax=Roseobacter cerasinus TaxID=2602289 RepID=A0A640VTG6_9RHOB|nr:prepilin peptidase [Roseobacter cerasinus]GFE51503.1 membrane protein [Roseobacter cerasinus]
MAITASSWVFLPFVLPLCFYVAFTDLSRMKITNPTVVALALVFVLVGPFVMPDLETYLWRLAQLAILLVAGVLLNAIGAMGAGDAKFIAAAAPFVDAGDFRLIIALLAGSVLAAFVTHRLVRASPLRQLAPHWASWDQDKKFPMGLALGMTLSLYLILGTVYGA